MPYFLRESPEIHQRARLFAPFLADGCISLTEALDVLMDAAIERGYAGDRSGLEARLAWTLLDSADAWKRRFEAAGNAVADAALPLIREDAAPAAIMRAAKRAADRIMPLSEDWMREYLRRLWDSVWRRPGR